MITDLDIIPPKQVMYKTAYSPMDECYVSINYAFTDADGNWIYSVSNNTKRIFHCLFRENELSNFCL